MATSGYSVGGSTSSGGTSAPEEPASGYWSLEKCKKAYLDYITNKREEIDEQQDARRYRHGSHWTAKQIEALNARKQPVVTYNRIGRKIDGIVGLVEKLRQDPKAYPRTPKHEEGAELATAALRYALEAGDWQAISPVSSETAAIDGIGGIEIELTEGDKGDREVGFDTVDGDGFFYDPRSVRMDFSDARFKGIGKWLAIEAAQDLFPDKAEEIEQAWDSSSDLSTDSDRDQRWFCQTGDLKQLRLVDIWYQHKGKWCWCIFTGKLKLMEGESYLFDEKGKTISKFIMFSAAVDHDGDRYGFVRSLKSAQDEINQRRSKGLHELNTRRIIGENGAFDDVEKARREAARPDGVVLRNKGFEAEFDDTARIANIEGQLKFLEEAKNEIENFGPNPALIGDDKGARSGRAIALLQQAGIAELGPYILAHRGWKIRVYRAIWSAIQRHWTAERWIRVTDDDGLAQFIQINGVQQDPMTGQQQIVNAIGSLDVDIILDEGPDTVTMMQDVYETLSQVIPSIAPMLTPPQATAAINLLVSTSALPASAKKQFKEASQAQPDPMQEEAKRVTLAGEAAKVEETKTKSMLNMANARKAMTPELPDMVQPQQQEFELPPEVQIGQAVAEIEETRATTAHRMAQAHKTNVDASLAPQQAAHQAQLDRAQLAQTARDKAEDRKIAARKPQASKS